MAPRKEEPKASAPKEEARTNRLEQLPFVREGRTLETTFTELEREGKAGLYELLKRAINDMPGSFFGEDNRRWNGALRREQTDLLNEFRLHGGTDVYGSTFRRAKEKWDGEIRNSPPQQLTEEERTRVFEIPEGGAVLEIPGRKPVRIAFPQPGTAYFGAAPRMRTPVHLEPLFIYWIEEFSAEVERAVEAFSENPNTHMELQRITNTLRSFEVGPSGKLILQPMQANASGMDLLAKFEHAKSRLASRLAEIAKEHDIETTESGTVDISPLSNDGKLEWQRSVQLLAKVFDELVKKGYLKRPRTKDGQTSNEKFARILLAHFTFSDGKDRNIKNLARNLGGHAIGTTVAKFALPHSNKFVPVEQQTPPT